MNQGLSDWFEPLYAKSWGDPTGVPWALLKVTPHLQHWLAEHDHPPGLTAVVIGCGLGDDAEALAAAGYQVTAFDIAATAIRWAKDRFPNSPVQYIVADLFDLPAVWQQQFDLVFEFRTIQALPLSVRFKVIENIAGLVASTGKLLVVTDLRADEETPQGPPWPLSESELAHFETLGMQATARGFSQPQNRRFAGQVMVEYGWPH